MVARNILVSLQCIQYGFLGHYHTITQNLHSNEVDRQELAKSEKKIQTHAMADQD